MQAAANICALLGLPSGDAGACTVQFGSNSHELVCRLLWTYLLAHHQDHNSISDGSSSDSGSPVPKPLRVLTTDTEFYSIVRQLNRLTEAGLVEVQTVAAEPADDFQQRCCAAVAAATAAGQQYDVLYVSQTTYLTQQTLIPSIPALVKGVQQAAATAAATGAPSMPAQQEQQVQHGTGVEQQQVRPWPAGQPLLIVDGYHGYCALPTNLGEVEEECCYVAGLLKHAGTIGHSLRWLTVQKWVCLSPFWHGLPHMN